MLRVGGGELRGRPLRVPAGARPSSSRLREAVLSRWTGRVAGARALDLFAGSGVFGIEVLSRGGERCVFVDRSRAAAEALRHNLRLVGENRAVRLRASLPEALHRPGPVQDEAPYDLVFADPPYRFDVRDELLAAVAPLVAAEARIAFEHPARAAPPDGEAAGLELLERRRYGDSAVAFYRLRPPGASAAASARGR